MAVPMPSPHFGAGREALREVDPIGLAVDVGLAERAEHVRRHLRLERVARQADAELACSTLSC